MKEKKIKEQEYKSTKNVIDLSDDIIKKLEEKEKELKEVDDTKEEKGKEIKLFYELNDEIKRESDLFNSFSKDMKDKLDKVNSSKKKNNTAKKLFYLMLAMELYRKTPKKASLSFILVESYLISKVLENTYTDNTNYQSICEDFQKEILKGIDDTDSFIKKIDTNFDTITKMEKELKSKYKDYLDTNPFKELFRDLENVTDMLKTRREELVDIHKSLDDNYKLSEEKIKILSYN